MSDEAQITSGETTSPRRQRGPGLSRPPGGAERAPAVVVVHEWWGLSDHIKDVARRFARAGYIAAAPDLYDGVVTRDEREASRLCGALPREGARLLANGRRRSARPGRGDERRRNGILHGRDLRPAPALPHAPRGRRPLLRRRPADTSILARLSCPVLFVGGARTTGSQWTRWGAWTERARSGERRGQNLRRRPRLLQRHAPRGL